MTSAGNNCPICFSEFLSFNDGFKMVCKNVCYTERKTGHSLIIDVFDKRFVFTMEDHSQEWKRIEENLNKEIDYWKENDRYLAEILSRG